MYKFLLFTLVIGFCACNSQTESKQLLLQHRIDSLETRLANSYKPGFGEFMSSVQTHHAKLWFAGQNQNWELADFEIHEMMEAMENIGKYQTERKESQKISMINPALDSVNQAILRKDPKMFQSSYVVLTNTCNNCHQAVDFGFNVVKVPEMQPFSNQEFKLKPNK